MEKKTAEEILRAHKIVRDAAHIQWASSCPTMADIIEAMEEYSSLQSEEKDKELQEAILTIHSENQKRLQLESEFNVYKKEADAALALGEKIITRKDEEIAEKDKEIDNLQRIIKEEREIRQRHEVTLSKMLAKQRDEIERLREALRSMVEFYESIHQINSELITDDETEKYKVAKALLKQDGIPSNVINNEVVKLREACKMAKTEIEKGTADQLTVNVLAEALSNQPIESDKIMKEEKQNGYAPINITQAEEIEAKDRRIKELEDLLMESLPYLVNSYNNIQDQRKFLNQIKALNIK